MAGQAPYIGPFAQSHPGVVASLVHRQQRTIGRCRAPRAMDA